LFKILDKSTALVMLRFDISLVIVIR